METSQKGLDSVADVQGPSSVGDALQHLIWPPAAHRPWLFQSPDACCPKLSISLKHSHPQEAGKNPNPKLSSNFKKPRDSTA